ncbi:MAG: HlyD family efflux transporter periplasmic adaptor subunit [Gammaproteobacteria bacterium]|nr:HlyD family efflux transporter periplasmic adaptor subunit [Gammaproteobacteria bacterium]
MAQSLLYLSSMDIVKVTKTTPLYRKYWTLIAGALLIAGLLIYANRFRNVTYMADAGSILMDSVTQGELLITVSGYGRLAPESIFFIGAESDGLIEQVMVRAGDRVTKGDPVLKLSNPQLLQLLEDTQLEAEAMEADYSSAKITRESELLDLQAAVESAQLDYQHANLDLQAMDELLSRGIQIISQLEHQRTRLNVEKVLKHWESLQQRLEKHKEALSAGDDAQRARLRQVQGTLERLRTQVANLTVRASLDGIVQEMSFRQGQQVRQGDLLTRIVRPDDLIAEVKVPELQVSSIELGMKADINTRSTIVKGEVSRIDPAVVDGTVVVEITLLDELPSEARPELNIEATIEIAHISETKFVRRPVFAQASRQANIYKLSEDGAFADRIPVRFGEASSNHIEVLEGLEAGDRVIISDPSAWENHERILIR